MPLAKQAKVLTKAQVDGVLAYLSGTRHPIRNRAILLLSVKAGLRAKEIASLSWDMVTDPEGRVELAIHLRDEASKGASGRVIPMNKDLRRALIELRESSSSAHVVSTERGDRTSAQVVVNLFHHWNRR